MATTKPKVKIKVALWSMNVDDILTKSLVALRQNGRYKDAEELNLRINKAMNPVMEIFNEYVESE